MSHDEQDERPDILSAQQAGELLGVSSQTVRVWADRGTIPGRRVGHKWRFSRRRLEQWVWDEEDDSSD